MEDKYKISVTTPNGAKLTYFVNNYEILDGGLIRFLDFRKRTYKIFDSRLCEIEEVMRNEQS